MGVEEVEIVLSFPWEGHEVGERLTVDRTVARQLVRGGAALYATKKDATAADDTADKTTSARKAAK